MIIRTCVPFIIGCLLAAQAPAGEAEQLAAIRRLGELNGVALHCQALAQTQRMKRELVRQLPKRRQLGELFDYETNASFLRFIQDKTRCPDLEAFKRSVDEALVELGRVYAGGPS
jgi:hypothetical protein